MKYNTMVRLGQSSKTAPAHPPGAPSGRRGAGLFPAAVAAAALSLSPAARLSAGEPTTLPASISENTYLSGEVLVNGRVEVRKGVTLHLAAGTTLRFIAVPPQPGGPPPGEEPVPPPGLVIDGQLLAAAPPGRRTVFTGGGEGNPWGGVEVRRGQAILENCDISGADNGLLALYAKVRMEGCRVTGCNIAVNVNTGSTLVVSRCTIAGNNVGVYCLEGGRAMIIGCDITDNRDVGISILRQSSPDILLNYLARNRYGVFLTWAQRILISGNIIEGNEYGVFTDRPDGNPVISDSLIRNNRFGVYSVQMSKAEVVNNIVSGNEYGIYCSRLAHADIRLNAISGNKTGIYAGQSSYPVIHGNNIQDNEHDVSLDQVSAEFNRAAMSAGGDWSIIDERTGKLGQTSKAKKRERIPDFRRARDEAFLFQGYVDATGNWWGEKTTAAMAGGGNAIMTLMDARQSPMMVFGGREYAMDSIRYAPWAPARLPDAGRLPVAEAGLGHPVPDTGGSR